MTCPSHSTPTWGGGGSIGVELEPKTIGWWIFPCSLAGLQLLNTIHSKDYRVHLVQEEETSLVLPSTEAHGSWATRWPIPIWSCCKPRRTRSRAGALVLKLWQLRLGNKRLCSSLSSIPNKNHPTELISVPHHSSEERGILATSRCVHRPEIKLTVFPYVHAVRMNLLLVTLAPPG